LVLFVHVADALPVRVECVVLPANVYDSGIAGSDTLQADVTQWSGTNVGAPATAGYPVVTVKVGTGTGEINVASGKVPATIAAGDIANNAITAAATAADFLAEVNAEVVDALNVDTYAEPGQGSPAATTTLVAKIGYLYKAWRNRTTTTASEYALYADDGTTKDQEAAISDDGTTFVKAEVATGA
jgi:hypothetical protein